MESLRGEYAFLHAGQDVVFNNRQINETRWFTFAGGVINTALADAIRACGANEVSSGDFLVTVTGGNGGRNLIERLRAMTVDEIIQTFIVSDEFIEKLKFSECLPNRIIHALLRGRMLASEDIEATVDRDVVVVEENS